MEQVGEAVANLDWLRGSTYPGRGIVMGYSEDRRHQVQVYWIMGRSDDSRNRVFVVEGKTVSTRAVDPAKVKDPSLIIYDAMKENDGVFVVSNGRQTNDVLNDVVDRGDNLSETLADWDHEPDPNHTPRITGVCIADGASPIGLHIIRKSPFGPGSDRFEYEYDDIGGGFGYGITTYSGDGNPLPPFTGEPRLMPLPGTIDEVLKLYWRALNEDNRISIAVKFIDVDTGVSEVKVLNKYQQVE